MELVRKKEVIASRGLTLTAASQIVKKAAKYGSQITFTANQVTVDAKDILDLMLLAACRGTQVEIRTDGPDRKDAMEAMVQMFDQRFGYKE